MKRISPSAPAVNSTVAEIKSRFTLRDVAANLGLELPTRDGVKFRSPLRHDRNPSCTIKGNVLFDWSTGEHFDAIDLFAAAKNISNGEAIRELAERLNIAGRVQDLGQNARKRQVTTVITSPARTEPIASQSAPVAFDESRPTDDDFAAILAARSWPEDALSGLLLAHDLGVLRFGKVCGCPCWIVTDEGRRIAEARRLDGKPFPAVGTLGERKAHTIRGSVKSWPVGLRLRIVPERLREFAVVLVEGGPDLMAAYAVLARLPMGARDVHPVAMLGTSATIAPDALGVEHYSTSGRAVVILAHGDDPGREAGRRWAKQLSGAGCRVTVRKLPQGKDLSDLLTERAPADLAALITPTTKP